MKRMVSAIKRTPREKRAMKILFIIVHNARERRHLQKNVHKSDLSN